MTLGFAPETIELWPLERLRPYAQNAKTHGPDQVARIAASIAEFGWTVPVLVADDGEVIAGHGRIMAATELGLTEAPVIVLGHLTEAQRRAYRIADNKLTELGGWDEALLAAELKELLADEFDLSLTGIEDGELDRLLRTWRPAAPLARPAACRRSSCRSRRATRCRARATSGSSATIACSAATAPARRTCAG